MYKVRGVIAAHHDPGAQGNLFADTGAASPCHMGLVKALMANLVRQTQFQAQAHWASH